MTAASPRAEADRVVALASRDLDRLWNLVAQGAAAEVALRDLLPAIVTEYGEVGAAMAAEWYDEQRAKVGAPGRFTAIPIEPGDRGTQALIGWALTEAADDLTLKDLILGGVSRRILDHIRYTIAGSAVADPAARGWQRIGTGDTCKFCQMLIGRGAVYSEKSVDFASHDHCNCEATPAWAHKPIPVKPYKVSPRRTIDPETGKPIPDADFERAQKWIADHL